jgi:hypothetical protein
MDLSQAITVPTPWTIDLAVIVSYGFAGWLMAWVPYLRRGSENITAWPIQVMIACKFSVTLGQSSDG